MCVLFFRKHPLSGQPYVFQINTTPFFKQGDVFMFAHSMSMWISSNFQHGTPTHGFNPLGSSSVGKLHSALVFTCVHSYMCMSSVVRNDMPTQGYIHINMYMCMRVHMYIRDSNANHIFILVITHNFLDMHTDILGTHHPLTLRVAARHCHDKEYSLWSPPYIYTYTPQLPAPPGLLPWASTLPPRCLMCVE